MFERVAPSEEQRDAEAREGRSPDQIAALRLAAILIVAEALIGLAVSVSIAGVRAAGQFIGVGIRLVMAYYLYKLRPRAEALALGLTILAGIVTLVGVGGSLSKAGLSILPFLIAIPPLGAVGALLLLLIGDPPREKRIAAIVVFAVLVALPMLLLLGLRVTHVLPPLPERVDVD